MELQNLLLKLDGLEILDTIPSPWNVHEKDDI